MVMIMAMMIIVMTTVIKSRICCNQLPLATTSMLSPRLKRVLDADISHILFSNVGLKGCAGLTAQTRVCKIKIRK